MSQYLKRAWVLIVSAYMFPFFASAHENYVLSESQIAYGMKDVSYKVFDALLAPGNLHIALATSFAGLILFLLYFYFQRSQIGKSIHKKLLAYEPFGHVMLRVALGVSFIASAYAGSYLGPEISLSTLPLGSFIYVLLYILGALLIAGLFTEVVGVLGFVTLCIATFVYKDYMLTYFNYFGELTVFIFFGSRIFSLDGILRTKKKVSEKYQDLEKMIIRVTYGISILYPAITIKLLHPSIIIEIVEKYHLNSITWLFPSDPLLIALGTGISQVVVGTCITLGLFTRLNTLITFVLMVTSIVFFKEAVWPHNVLLALALYLMINNGGKWGLDRYLKGRKSA